MSQQFTAAFEIVTAKDIMIKTVGIENVNEIKENDELTKAKKDENKITQIVTAKDIMIKTVGIENVKGIKENDELTKAKKDETKITQTQDKVHSTCISMPADDSTITKRSEQNVKADVVVKNETANGEADGRQVAKEEQEKKRDPETTEVKCNELKSMPKPDKVHSTCISKPADDSTIIKRSEQNVKADVVVKNKTANSEAGGRQVAKEEQEKKRDPETTEVKCNELKSMPKPDEVLLKIQFKLFSKYGDKSADGSTIKLSQSDKWFKQAGVIKHKGICNTDTSIAFRKVAKKAIRISFVDWIKYLDEIATSKKMDVNTIKTKLVECGKPGFTKVDKSAALACLTLTVTAPINI